MARLDYDAILSSANIKEARKTRRAEIRRVAYPSRCRISALSSAGFTGLGSASHPAAQRFVRRCA